MILSLAKRSPVSVPPATSTAPATGAYKDDLFDMYGCVSDDAGPMAISDDLHESRVDEELQRWISCNERLATIASKAL